VPPTPGLFARAQAHNWNARSDVLAYLLPVYIGQNVTGALYPKLFSTVMSAIAQITLACVLNIPPRMRMNCHE
jgi:hypothetical protein